MFRTLPLVALLAVSACVGTQSSDRDRCISRAGAQLTTLNRLIAETQANVARGYALETVRDVRTIDRTCRGQNADGTSFRYPCPETIESTRRVPVAINLNDEQDKLNSMVARRTEMERSVQATIAQCQATYPVAPGQ